MIENRPSIYNATSVYNQGGGVSTFDVDINNVTNTLLFPAYLTPVEYIDLSNYTGEKTFTIECPEQIDIVANASKLVSKYVIKADASKVTSTIQKPYNYFDISETSNNEVRAYLTKDSNNVGHVFIICGIRQKDLSPIDFSKKLALINKNSQNLFEVREEGGNVYSGTDNRSMPKRNYGRLLLFHSNDSNTFFYGRIYYGYMYNEVTGKILSIVIPARSKDENDKKPYFVECVTGSVGTNISPDSSVNGIEFGPDIDLSDISNYFV